jgi:hypothetical protein
MAYQYYLALTYDALTGENAPDQRLHATYGRLPAMGWKVAIVLAALDWATDDQEKPIITPAHWARAQMIVEKWRASAHRFLDMVTVSEQATAEATVEDRVLHLIEAGNGAGVTLRDLYRCLNLRRDAVEAIANGLAHDGLIEKQTVKNDHGRSSTLYRSYGVDEKP